MLSHALSENSIIPGKDHAFPENSLPCRPLKILLSQTFPLFADAAKSHATATQQRIAASTSCLLVVIPVSEDELFARYLP
ncbi:hypothetical protein CEXT_129811 [Caerostris extrusa]|uniref:Uncharacterized protein n=1 Tax=Caerostris extrusa TaxID=172846 RepID=A0AAV4NZ88_CAEEX|nr:hypothetical protein CEXT_129811 [Caerostris extrusa]